MEFIWDNFTERDFKQYINKRMNQVFDIHDYLGAVHVGDICIDLVDQGEEGLLLGDFYVAHENTGYGYSEDGVPYDYADGVAMDIPYGLTYQQFQRKAEQSFMGYIKSYGGVYSLEEHANRPLEKW